MWARENIAVNVVGSEWYIHTPWNPVKHRFNVISICWTATWGKLLALICFMAVD